MAKDPGSNLDTARLFPIGATSRTLKNTLSPTDRLDVWKMKLRASNFSVALKDLVKNTDADLYLLNSKGQTIASSRRRGNKNEALNNLLLPSGTYYVAVLLDESSGGTKYALTMSAPAPTDFLGNTFDTAFGLSVTSAGTTFSEVVTKRDPDDFIRFRLAAPGRLKLDLKNLSSNVDLELYDRNRTLIKRSANLNTINEKLSQRLIDYGSIFYVRMAHKPGKDGVYTFSYTFTPDTQTATASGLKYVDLVPGAGVTPTAGQTLAVQYTGTLENGAVFDTSRDNNQPFVFRLGTNSVIPGFEEGLSTMQVGGRRQLIIPADLAYGATGSGSIPPNSTIIFDVELISVS